MMKLFIALCFTLVASEAPNYDDLIATLMTTDMTPNPGPEMDTVYIPGTPGGQWSPEEIDVTRKRILQMIHPVWIVKNAMGNSETKLGRWNDDTTGDVTENVLLRLAFHDCIPYEDGSGGCDGCLNAGGFLDPTPNENDHDQFYTHTPINATNNKGLDKIAERLELIYTTIDWPFIEASQEVSLFQSGKSRADLWQLAGLVALEQTLERANRACDLDFHARQQVTLLESREKCEIKLTSPVKFKTGRIDCVSDDPEGRAYITTKHENHPMAFGDSSHIMEFGKNEFHMDPEHWIATAIGVHGVVHQAHMGVKYTWFGPGYLSNMLFKMIANYKTYNFNKGGDLAFTSGSENVPIKMYAIGDKQGNPVNITGWRASCMYMWDTEEGGPCFLRPTPVSAFDNPGKKQVVASGCILGVNSDGTCNLKSFCEKKRGAYCDENNIIHGGILAGVKSEAVGPVTDDMSEDELESRWVQGFDNQFAFPWEIGMYWKFHVGGVGQRAMGCPGLDEDFGTVSNPKWPFVVNKDTIPIWASPAMDCEKNEETAGIVEELASDNEHFAKLFLEGWQMMVANGYSESELIDGPENAWIGYYSLTNQGIEIDDFASYIENNAPVTFTDPTADPWICGHRGHSTTSCGYRFSRYFELAENGAKYATVLYDSSIGQVL